MKKARATNHAGKGTTRHNFREFPQETKEKGKSDINRNLTNNNQYYIAGEFYNNEQLNRFYRTHKNYFEKQAFKYRSNPNYADLTNSQKLELGLYECLVQESIKGQHNRNKQHRQEHLNRDVLDVLLSPKTSPEECILQVGNKDYCPVSSEQLWSIFKDYVKMHNSKFGEYIKILDAVLHTDETTPHIHVRKAYIGKNRHEEAIISKNSALELLGIERPDMSKLQSRYNNRKQTYTAKCRQMWLDICRKHGLNLETEPRVYGDSHGLELTEYKVRQEQEKLDKVNQYIEEQKKIIFKSAEIINKQNDKIMYYEDNWNDVDMAIYVSNTVKAEYPEYYADVTKSYWQEKQADINYLEL